MPYADTTVVVTDHDFDDLSVERAILEDVAEIRDLSSDGDDEASTDTGAALASADGVLNLRYEITADEIERMEDCRIIARYGIGVDNVAVDAAAERGIPVTNVPDYCVEEVVTHAITLMLSLVRGVKRFDASVADGAWTREAGPRINRLSEQTVGVVGYGAIGRRFGAQMAGLGADVVASDPFLTPEDLDDDPAALVEFEELLSRADTISIHSPLTDETEGLFDDNAFEQLNDEAYLVNVARGAIVDDDALERALNEGQIRGAGLDVFPQEPPHEDHPLRDHPRVVTTPHVAWYSEEANEERRRSAARNVRAAIEGETPENVVNNPN